MKILRVDFELGGVRFTAHPNLKSIVISDPASFDNAGLRTINNAASDIFDAAEKIEAAFAPKAFDATEEGEGEPE